MEGEVRGSLADGREGYDGEQGVGAGPGRVRGERALGPAYIGVIARSTASSSPIGGVPWLGFHVWSGRQTMSWRSDSISDVTVWKGAVVVRAAASPTSPGGTTGTGTRSRARPAARPHTCSRSG